jgi:hypothetical protein
VVADSAGYVSFSRPRVVGGFKPFSPGGGFSLVSAAALVTEIYPGVFSTYIYVCIVVYICTYIHTYSGESNFNSNKSTNLKPTLKKI